MTLWCKNEAARAEKIFVWYRGMSRLIELSGTSSPWEFHWMNQKPLDWDLEKRNLVSSVGETWVWNNFSVSSVEYGNGID